MRLQQLLRALETDQEITLRDIFLRFEESEHPDKLGPPGRWPIIQLLANHPRLSLIAERWSLKLKD